MKKQIGIILALFFSCVSFSLYAESEVNEPSFAFFGEGQDLVCLANNSIIELISKEGLKSGPSKPIATLFNGAFLAKFTELGLFDAFSERLSKEDCKAVGKFVKGIYNGEGAYGLVTIVLSNRVGSWGANKILNSRPGLPLAVSMFAVVKVLEQVSKPEMFLALTSQRTSEIQRAIDYWGARPAIKSLSTSWRYAVEKMMQSQYIYPLVPTFLALTLNRLPINNGFSNNVGKGWAIGVSKVGTAIVAQSIVSASELGLDAISNEPEFETFCSRSARFFQNFATNVIVVTIIGFTLPLALTAARYVTFITLSAAQYIYLRIVLI